MAHPLEVELAAAVVRGPNPQSTQVLIGAGVEGGDVGEELEVEVGDGEGVGLTKLGSRLQAEASNVVAASASALVGGPATFVRFIRTDAVTRSANTFQQ